LTNTPAPALRRDGTNWTTLIAFAIFHAGAIAALFFFSWPALICAFVLYYMSLSWGIGMSYHRLLTHRSYKVPKALEYFITICATLALEGGPMFWVATHRIHHRYSDHPGDPHSPRDGRWWSHIGWMLSGDVGHSKSTLLAKYAPDLARDRFHMLLSEYHWVPLTVVGALLWYFGGLSFLLWGVFLRVTIGWHATWAVNSATHLWGYRRFETRDDSRNNVWVAAASFGEGWHNNHHAHPVSARHGMGRYELDISWLTIRLLEMLGIATSVKLARLTSPVEEEIAA
jgi:fatty-acid desaturase